MNVPFLSSSARVVARFANAVEEPDAGSPGGHAQRLHTTTVPKDPNTPANSDTNSHRKGYQSHSLLPQLKAAHRFRATHVVPS